MRPKRRRSPRISLRHYVEGSFAFERHFPQPSDSENPWGWFKVINIAGAKLTNRELRNAVHAGPWVADARYISEAGVPPSR